MKPHGKMQRLVDNLTRFAGAPVAAQVTEGLQIPPTGATPAVKTEWVRTVIDRMDALLPEAQRRQVMEARCCPQSKTGIAADLELWHDCDDLADYARRKAPNWGGDGFVAEGNSLRMRISRGRCYCTLQGSAAAPVSKTHCLCCAGHLRGYLEPVFEMPVPVDPISTVISGDPECWFVAYVGGRQNRQRPPVRPAVRQQPQAPAPLKTRVAPLPARLPVRDRTALSQVHRALVAIAAASTAATPAQQLQMKGARPRMLAALWCIARSGQVRDHALYCETALTRGQGRQMPEPQGAEELRRYGIPGLDVTVTVTRRTYPKRWEVTLALASRRGLAALQGYAEALCQAYGEPVFAGSNRFRGEAYRLFCRADLSVMAEQPVTETSA